MKLENENLNEAETPQLNIAAVSGSYFHELPQEDVDKLITEKRTVKYVVDNYKQPDWCGYPEALSMTMGCWSLCDLQKEGLRTKISKDFCSTCDSYNCH